MGGRGNVRAGEELHMSEQVRDGAKKMEEYV
jgi:hypothetical protein